jgi:hypothetical protein
MLWYVVCTLAHARSVVSIPLDMNEIDLVFLENKRHLPNNTPATTCFPVCFISMRTIFQSLSLTNVTVQKQP